MIDYRRFCAKFTPPGHAALGGEACRPRTRPRARKDLIQTKQVQDGVAIVWRGVAGASEVN